MAGGGGGVPSGLKTYAGVYIAMVFSHVPRAGLPPINNTVASGRRSELEWYKRAKAFWPAELKVFVAGSYKSALRLAVPVSSSFREPPSAMILPLGRIVAFISMRGWDIDGPLDHFGVAADKSMSSVVAVDGWPPPIIMTTGL